MTFLAPALGLIAGALGALGVLVSYFLKLRRRPIRVASTLLWERAVQDLQVNAPFRWLRASLLLLLQLLIVACVALALARPVIPGDGPDADRVILILDTSASMSARDGADGKSRFEGARDRAIERIGRLPRGAQVMVIASALEAETAMGFTRDHGAARAVVRGLEPTDQPGDLKGAMRVVGAYARQTSEEEAESLPAIYLYTDGGDVPRGGLGVPVPADRVVVERVGPEAEASKNNTGLAAIAARRDFEDPALVRLFARVVNARNAPTQALVRLLIDGEPVEAKRVELPGVDENGLPGEASVTFQLRDSDGALALLSLTGDDALEADNEAGVVLSPPRDPRVTVVQPAGEPSISEALLLEAFYAIGSREVERLTADEYDERSQQDNFFALRDLIVFDGVRPDALPPVPTMSFGATVPVPGVAMEQTRDGAQRIAFWSRSHPSMRYVSLGDVFVDAPRRLSLPEGGPVRTEELATGESGTLIASVESDGVRRLLVAFRLSESTWEKDPSFPLFVANGADWLTLTSARDAATGTTTSRPASLFDDTLPAGLDVTLRGPAGTERTGTSEASGRVVFGVLPRAGLYAAQLPTGERTIAVNLADAGESSLRTSDAPVVAGDIEANAPGARAEGTREVWRWFVLGALALLALEWALYAWKMRL